MKIEPVTGIWIFVCAMNFWAARNIKKWSFGLFRPNLSQCSFREISMIKMVILDQNKPIWLILKIKKLKIKKSVICTLHVYYSQKRKLDKYMT